MPNISTQVMNFALSNQGVIDDHILGSDAFSELIAKLMDEACEDLLDEELDNGGDDQDVQGFFGDDEWAAKVPDGKGVNSQSKVAQKGQNSSNSGAQKTIPLYNGDERIVALVDVPEYVKHLLGKVSEEVLTLLVKFEKLGTLAQGIKSELDAKTMNKKAKEDLLIYSSGHFNGGLSDVVMNAIAMTHLSEDAYQKNSVFKQWKKQYQVLYDLKKKGSVSDELLTLFAKASSDTIAKHKNNVKFLGKVLGLMEDALDKMADKILSPYAFSMIDRDGSEEGLDIKTAHAIYARLKDQGVLDTEVDEEGKILKTDLGGVNLGEFEKYRGQIEAMLVKWKKVFNKDYIQEDIMAALMKKMETLDIDQFLDAVDKTVGKEQLEFMIFSMTQKQINKAQDKLDTEKKEKKKEEDYEVAKADAQLYAQARAKRKRAEAIYYAQMRAHARARERQGKRKRSA